MHLEVEKFKFNKYIDRYILYLQPREPQDTKIIKNIYNDQFEFQSLIS